MSRQSSVESVVEDPFSLDDIMVKAESSFPGEEMAEPYKQKASVVKRVKFTSGAVAKTKDRNAARLRGEEKRKHKELRAEQKAKAKAAQPEPVDATKGVKRSKRTPPAPDVLAQREAEKKALADRVARSREAAESIIRQSVNHGLFHAELEFTRAFTKCSRNMKQEIIKSLRTAAETAINEAVEKIQNSTVIN